MPSTLGIVASQRTAVAAFPMTGVQMWVDADDASTFSYSSGSNVSEWRDKSPNAIKFAHAGGQPGVRQAGVVNGRSAVWCHPTQLLSQNLSTGMWVDQGDMTSCMLFSVVTFDTPGIAGSAWFGHGADGAGMINLEVADPGGWSIFTVGNRSVNGGSTYFHSPSLTGNTAYQWGYTKQGNTDTVRLNGADVPNVPGSVTATTMIPQTAQAYIGVNFGGGGNFVGRVAELIFVNRYNLAQRDAIEAYLRNKWGTP
jgi:hypothetical protein